MNTRLYSQEPTKSKILHRLKIAKGHIGKIIQMVESDAYCIDIIHQSQAIQSALRKIDQVILENHLKSCVLGNVRIEKLKRDKLTKELMEVFQKSQE